MDWITKKWLLETFMESEGLTWDDPWLQSLDLEYHNIDPEKGLFFGVNPAKRIGEWNNSVRRNEASYHPPANTRAAGRAQAVAWFQKSDQPYVINWDSIACDSRDFLVMGNPFEDYTAEVAKFLAHPRPPRPAGQGSHRASKKAETSAASSRASGMIASAPSRKVALAVCGCAGGVLLLGAVLAVSECDRKIAAHFQRVSRQKARTAEDAITPVAKDPERHAQFLERSRQGEIDLVFLGDSITDRWPRVGERSWQKLAPYKPANFGIEGDCTEHLLWRLEHGELDAISPKVVVVLIGTNNVFYFADEKPEWTANGIEKVVSLIRKRAPKSKVLLFGILPRDEKDSRVRRTIAAVNREIQRLDDGANIRFADIGAEFLDGDGNIPPDIMPDQVHLSAKGYDIWHRSLESILPRMLE